MKRYTLLLAGGLLLTSLFSSCVKTDSLKQLADISFFYTYDQALASSFQNPTDTVLPVATPELELPLLGFSTNIGEIAKEKNTSSDKLISVKIDSLILSLTDPASLKLDFIKSVKIYISAKGQPEVLAAEKNPVPAGLRTLALEVRAGELKSYFQQDSVQLRVVAALNGIPPSTTKINLKNLIKVVANPLN